MSRARYFVHHYQRTVNRRLKRNVTRINFVKSQLFSSKNRTSHFGVQQRKRNNSVIKPIDTEFWEAQMQANPIFRRAYSPTGF